MMNGASTSLKDGDGQGHARTPTPNGTFQSQTAENDKGKVDASSVLPPRFADDFVPVIHLLGSMSYENSRVHIYKQAGEPDKFFYEPIMELDLDSVRRVMSSGENQVRFRIHMWHEDVESSVWEWLMKRFDVEEEEGVNVQVFPYDEVRLVKKRSGASFRLPVCPTTYYQLKESLAFYLSCDTKKEAEQLVEDIIADPESWMDQHLELECSSTAFLKSLRPESDQTTAGGSSSSSSPGIQQRFCINIVEDGTCKKKVRTDRSSENRMKKEIEELKCNIKGMKSDLASRNADSDLGTRFSSFTNVFKNFVAVSRNDGYLFSVYRETDYDAGPLGYLSYEQGWPVHPSLNGFGTFDLNTGIFKAARPGIYLFCFYGTAHPAAGSTSVSLSINGVFRFSSKAPGNGGSRSLCFKEMLGVKVGDEVRMVVTKGKVQFPKGGGCLSSDQQQAVVHPCGFVGYHVA